MTVEELMAELEELPPGAEVRFAMQPNYPLEYAIGSIVEVDLNEEGQPETNSIVYLTEAHQIGYLSSYAADIIGW